MVLRKLFGLGDSSQPQPTVAPTGPAVDAAGLWQQIGAYEQEFVKLSGQLPVDAVVLTRLILDQLRDIARDPVDSQTAAFVQSVVGDYLPTSVSTFAAARQHGAVPDEQIVSQLSVIGEAVQKAAEPARQHDMRALEVQTRFLSSRLGR